MRTDHPGPVVFENLLATATFAATAAALPATALLLDPYAVSGWVRAFIALPMTLYVVLLAVGAWRIRPDPARRGVFSLLMAPVLAQGAIYGMLAVRVLRIAAETRVLPAFGQMNALASAASILLCTAWIGPRLLEKRAYGAEFLHHAERVGALVLVFIPLFLSAFARVAGVVP